MWYPENSGRWNCADRFRVLLCLPDGEIPPQEDNGKIVANPRLAGIVGINNDPPHASLLSSRVADGVSPSLNAVEERDDPQSDAMGRREDDMAAD